MAKYRKNPSRELSDMERDFTLLMARDRALIEDYLSGVFRDEPRYADLQEAMEYSLLAGG